MKNTALLIFLFLSVCLSAQAPPNDLCSGAIPLTPGTGFCTTATQAFINTSGTDSGESPTPSCGNFGGFDIWYSVVVPASGTLAIDPSSDGTGTMEDIAIEAYSGSCGNLTPIGCDDFISFVMYLPNLDPESTIYLRVWDDGSDDFGSFNICAYDPPPPPVNDPCTGAINLNPDSGSCASPTQAIINNVTIDFSDGPFPSCGLFGGYDIWYSVMVPASGELVIETSSDGTGTITDTVIEAYSGTCGGLTFIECDDDDGAGFYSYLNLSNLTPNSIIYIRAWENLNNLTLLDFGSFNICVNDPSFIPGNDLCTDAISISCGDLVLGSLEYANPQASSDCGGNDSDGGVWYTFTSSSNFEVSLSTCWIGGDPNLDTRISVYEGNCSNLVCVQNGYNDNDSDCGFFGVAFPYSSLTFEALANTQYYIEITYEENMLVNSYNYTLTVDCVEFCPIPTMDADMDGIADNDDLCPTDRDVSLRFQDRGGQAGNTSDHVEIPHHSGFNFTDGDFAFEAWINPSSGDYKTIVSKGNGSNASTQYIFGIMADDDTFFSQPSKLGLFLSDGSTTEWQFSHTNIPQNTWTHVAVSVDNSGANPIATFYYNGALDGVKTYALSNLYNGDTNSLFIGRQGYGCQCNHFDGRMDELALWNKTLGASDIAISMSAPYAGTESGLVAYYDFNDADASVDNTGNTTLIDKTNNYDGALINFELIDCNSNWASGHNRGACEPCQTDYSNGLISYWNFDNNVEDHRGPNDGTIIGAGSSYAPGIFGNGIDLDGATTYINAGNDPSLNFTNKSLTISAWFRVDAFDKFWQALISKGEADNFRVQRFGDSNFMSYNGGPPDIAANVNVNDGMFHHIVVVTKANVSKSIYIDGVLITTAPIGVNILDSGLDLLIGNNPDVSDRYWNGMIDDMAIWDIPLNDCDVSFLYNSQMSLAEFTDLDSCLPVLTLSGSQSSTVDYESGGSITSTEMINSPAQVDYDATTEINLLQDFEVKVGAVFHAFIDGCGGNQ